MDQPEIDFEYVGWVRALFEPIFRFVRRALIAIGAIVVLIPIWLFAPITPHSPACSSLYHFEIGWEKPIPDGFRYSWRINSWSILGPMSTAYVNRFTRFLRQFDVFYIRIGNHVFLRLWDWVSESNDWVTNADGKTISILARPYERTIRMLITGNGPVKNPIWDSMPPDIRARIAKLEHPGDAIDDCELARALTIENWGRGG